VPTLTLEQVQTIINQVTEHGRARVKLHGLAEAHGIVFAAGAMAVFEALGIWDKVPMEWHIAVLRGQDPFTGQFYEREGD
jgi:hypothetical protein